MGSGRSIDQVGSKSRLIQHDLHLEESSPFYPFHRPGRLRKRSHALLSAVPAGSSCLPPSSGWRENILSDSHPIRGVCRFDFQQTTRTECTRYMEAIRLLMKRPRLETNATRRSLLMRLERWEDNKSWQEFFEAYWRLIYKVARQAGLGDLDAQDVVQDTVLSVAKQIGKFKYDPNVCSFKGWLLTLTRRRIADKFRKLCREVPIAPDEPKDTRATPQIERIPDPQAVNLESLWDQEWQLNLLEAALGRVKRKANPTEFQIFYLHAVKEQSSKDVARALGVNRARVYLAKHRISNLLKKEIEYLESKAP